jgi:hypothetical protein
MSAAVWILQLVAMLILTGALTGSVLLGVSWVLDRWTR